MPRRFGTRARMRFALATWSLLRQRGHASRESSSSSSSNKQQQTRCRRGQPVSLSQSQSLSVYLPAASRAKGQVIPCTSASAATARPHMERTLAEVSGGSGCWRTGVSRSGPEPPALFPACSKGTAAAPGARGGRSDILLENRAAYASISLPNSGPGSERKRESKVHLRDST